MLGHRSSYSREGELSVLYPHIATYLNDCDLLTLMSIFRPTDPDRISIARRWEGSLQIPSSKFHRSSLETMTQIYKFVSAETLRGLTSLKKVTVLNRKTSRGTERTLRLFRLALMTKTFSNLEHLHLNITNNHMNAVSAFFYDFLDGLPTLTKLKSFDLENDNDPHFFAEGRRERILESMSQLPMLESFSFLSLFECRASWPASVVGTFLRLKWPSLKKLQTHQITFKAPVFALDRLLLADAFANGHFPCVDSMEIGEFLGGDLYSCLPEDVSQIKHLTIQGRILRSPLLNFTNIPIGNFQSISGGGGTITTSKFSGLTSLDLSGLHVSDVMAFYQNFETQGMYCLSFHNNTLRALNNLTTVLSNSNKMESMELSNCTLDPSYYCPFEYFAKNLSFAAQNDAHRDLKNARLRCFCTLAKFVRTLSIKEVKDM